jgi:hypothetical protein
MHANQRDHGPMSTLDFTSVTQQDVSATYAGMPTNAKILFVSNISGTRSGGVTVSGSGSVTIPLAGLASGDYYLLADDSSGNYLAQSVVFHV